LKPVPKPAGPGQFIDDFFHIGVSTAPGQMQFDVILSGAAPRCA
jgi:hypothetical protein